MGKGFAFRSIMYIAMDQWLLVCGIPAAVILIWTIVAVVRPLREWLP